MTTVRSLLQEYDEIKKELDSLTCLTLAPGTPKYEQAEKAGYRLRQKAYEIVEASRQIQALLDEPVGEVERFDIDHFPDPEGVKVNASDYDDLLAKYNSLRSEKASDGVEVGEAKMRAHFMRACELSEHSETCGADEWKAAAFECRQEIHAAEMQAQSLIATVKALTLEVEQLKASDLEAWRDMAARVKPSLWHGRPAYEYAAQPITAGEPLYEKIKQAQLSGEGSGEGK